MGGELLGDVGPVELGPHLERADDAHPGALGAGGVLARLRILGGLERLPGGPLPVLVLAADLHLGRIGLARPGHAHHGPGLLGEVTHLDAVGLDQRGVRQRHVDHAGLAVGDGRVGQSGSRAERDGAGGHRGGGRRHQRAAAEGEGAGVGLGGKGPVGHHEGSGGERTGDPGARRRGVERSTGARRGTVHRSPRPRTHREEPVTIAQRTSVPRRVLGGLARGRRQSDPSAPARGIRALPVPEVPDGRRGRAVGISPVGPPSAVCALRRGGPASREDQAARIRPPWSPRTPLWTPRRRGPRSRRPGSPRPWTRSSRRPRPPSPRTASRSTPP